MNKKQKEFVCKLELILAQLVYDGQKKWAAALAPVVEWLHKGEPVIAVLEGEAVGLSEETLDCIRLAFNVKQF